MQETWVPSLGQEGSLEKEMATHSSILPYRIPWTEEPGGRQSMGLHTVGQDLPINHHHICPGEIDSVKKICTICLPGAKPILPWGPSTCAGDLKGLLMVALRSQGNWRWEGPLGLHWVWCIGRGPHLQLRQEPQGSSDFRLRSQDPCRLGTGESDLVLG